MTSNSTICDHLFVNLEYNLIVLEQLDSPAFVSPFAVPAIKDARIASSSLGRTPVLPAYVPQPIQEMLERANYTLVSLTTIGQGMGYYYFILLLLLILFLLLLFLLLLLLFLLLLLLL